MPPADPYIPTAPFQAISSDYLELQGRRYLLTVDRFSNWPDIREATVHSGDSGANGLIKAYRELFATFGVPEELSSDGGPEYVSNTFEEFLRVWGVKHAFPLHTILNRMAELRSHLNQCNAFCVTMLIAKGSLTLML